MRGVRPLERADLEAVCVLYERVVRSGSSAPPPELRGYFERTLLDHPWADPEIPSLVYEGPGGRIDGFIGSHVRRLRLDGKPLKMACSGQFVADSRESGPVGALLLRAYLAGRQDLTVTDGANEISRRMWEKLSGVTLSHSSISWTRVLRPVAAGSAWSHRRPRLARALRVLSPPLDAAARAIGRSLLVPAESPLTAEPLSAAALASQKPQMAARFDLYPDYDLAFLDWLFREAEAVSPRGGLVRHLLRAPSGEVAGWYVAYISPGRFAQVLQLAAPGGDPGRVLDHLFRYASGRGVAAVIGRVEPQLIASLVGRRCIFRPSSWALAHSPESRILSVLSCGRSMLTRLDGEWWMGHDLLWR